MLLPTKSHSHSRSLRTLPLWAGLALAVLLAACRRAAPGQAEISGSFDHLQQAQLYVYGEGADFQRFDTINVVQGDFHYTTPLSEPTVLTLMFPNFSETMFVAEPGVALTYEADAKHLLQAEVSGSEANDSLTAFRLRHATEPLAAQRKDAEAYIRRRPADMASVALFQKYFVRVETLQAEPTTALLALLCKALPRHNGLAALRQRLTPQLRTATGAKAPALLTKGGLPAAYVFTLGTQYESTQLLQEIRRQAEARGGVRVEEIKADDRDFDSLRHTYGLRYVPGCLIIDAKGRIAARDLPYEDVAAAVRKL